ncbi:MAG: DNA translocase FtsK 4TM domain-containing protein [Candidatus Moraniibacteriota bacterium]
MGRKKKDQSEKKPDEKRREGLGSDAKRGIVALFLLAFSILCLLSFIGQAGSFGGVVDRLVGVTVGWSKWLLIPLLPLIGYFIVRRHETRLSDVIRYTGLGFAFFAFLGLSHLFLGDTAATLRSVALDREGGGFIGYLLASLLSGAMGKIAAFVVLFTLFVSGVIAAFNVSLLHWFERVTARFRPVVADGATGDMPRVEGVPSQTSDAALSLEGALQSAEISSPGLDVIEEKAETPAVQPTGNIQNIRFAENESTGTETAPEKGDGAMSGGNSEEETVLVPAFIRPKRRRVQWELPPLELLAASDAKGGGGDIEQNKDIIIRTLKHFHIDVEPGEVQVGPTVTQYTFRPAVGVKISSITPLHNDLALALAAQHIRIEAPIPGKSLIGIEVPNKAKVNVRLREFLQSKEFRERHSNLTIILGQDVSGRLVYADLGRMPHLLIAGTTRSGKSVCINTLILSLLYQNSPEDLKLIFVDPKRVELSLYKGIPHLKTDVIVDNHKVVNALKWAVGEMERRYKALEAVGSRDISSYREKLARGEKKRVVDTESSEVREEELAPMPQVVIVIDEMADLMVAHGKEVESSIILLAQKGRAAGIHLVLATQRPEVNVVTGLIKANMPARISFKLKSNVDSRTILDTGGAEKLLGNGDMLYSSAETSTLQRIQGVFVSEDEVEKVVRFLERQKVEKGMDEIGEDFGGGDEHPIDLDGVGEADEDEHDPIYQAAKKLVVETQRASTTYLQTFLKIGYPKAARVMQTLEQRGVVGPEVNKKREVILKTLEEGKQYGDDPLSDQAAREKWQL